MKRQKRTKQLDSTFLALEAVLRGKSYQERLAKFSDLLEAMFGSSSPAVGLFVANFSFCLLKKENELSRKEYSNWVNKLSDYLESVEFERKYNIDQPALDLSNDTEAERRLLANKVFAFISNPHSDQKQVREIESQLCELLELYPNQKPDWKKSEGLLTALICEPNALCYRETFTEIVSLLDLSNHSTAEGECLDLSKNVITKISDPATDQQTKEKLNSLVSEMVSGGLETYPPEVVEAFLCAPENSGYQKHFKEIIEGENK